MREWNEPMRSRWDRRGIPMRCWLGLVVWMAVGFGGAAAEPIPPERLHTMVEVMSRMNREQMEANPALRKALEQVLEATRGTGDYLRLVKALRWPGQAQGLLEVVRGSAAPDVAAEAMRLILSEGSAGELESVLAREQPLASFRLVDALGNSLDRRAVPVLMSVIREAARDLGVRRAAVRAVVRMQEGALALLGLAKEGELTADLRLVATTELGSVRWASIKAAAAGLFPSLPGAKAPAMPPVGELMRRKGDAEKGAAVFRSDAVGCIRCHQIGDEGTDFGPKLTEIGSKLGRDALYEAVLNPSSGISFGYEAWQINRKDGDEAYGLLVSETEEELAIKAPGGVVTRHRKADVATREKLKGSIMPTGLQEAMTPEELVDLIEYLTTLQKAEGR